MGCVTEEQKLLTLDFFDCFFFSFFLFLEIRQLNAITASEARSVKWPGYGLDDSRKGQGFFLLATRPKHLCGPPSFLSNGHRGLLPRR